MKRPPPIPTRTDTLCPNTSLFRSFFEDLPEQPYLWTYRTIATHGEMLVLRFVFAEPPIAVVYFSRTGTMLTGRGQGSVRIDGPDGCLLELTLPFQQRLPAACLATG